jgi:hypothetical protein
MRGLRIVMFILLALISDTRANQVFLKTIPLEQLVRSSDMILVVRPLKPFYLNESIKIPGENRREPSQPIPDFQTQACSVEIVRVIRDRSCGTQPGAKIAIYPAYTGRNLGLHTMYYAEARSKSPLYNAYDSGVRDERELETGAEFVAFVTCSRKRDVGRTDFEFAVVRGYDRMDVIPKIEEIVRKTDAAR